MKARINTNKLLLGRSFYIYYHLNTGYSGRDYGSGREKIRETYPGPRISRYFQVVGGMSCRLKLN